ncbi:Gfo/Idh/MocA family protein [Saccharomonospora viridis]|jgi:predicted dehydrogenase|uniref:Glycosyl hydrolase family 109 protein n=1 Tax=Saccharomonospora viridis TaxID=1852 RepID=A0A837D4V3_9PSEU|nr:Gfo/Idh/MocA family oxidoreductase [Saccharomonospora viridis]KHF42849.1 glycosyl hydrolase [Saccharomonospora viridis]SFO90190.1 Oxidoreductase family, NAD-binding Rossmann fold [Saccharomonospora viridis]
MVDVRPSRRSFLQSVGLAAGVVAASGAIPANAVTSTAEAPQRARGQRSMIGVPFDRYDEVRIGLIGLGNRGMGMLSGWTAVPGAVVTAVCDVVPDHAQRAAEAVKSETGRRPTVYTGSDKAYEELCASDDVDFVYVATPWEWHFRQGMAALRNGKHVGIELPIATELKELWQLVDASERARRHCFLMENCSYGRNELAILRMAHDGLFGELTNGHGGYLHDLRELLFNGHYTPEDWRRAWHTKIDASFYAMHGLAPIAACMDINRGDRFTYLTATSSAALGLADYRERFMPKDHPSWSETYVKGDRTTCMLMTAKGRMVRAEHDVSSPRPYSRINSIAGTRGVFEDYPTRIYVEPDHTNHQWADAKPYLDRYDHWLWRKVGDDAENNGGHGGMDYILQWRIIQQMRAGLVPDIDVYDSAAWCAPVPLSAESIRKGSRPVAVPDFTRGRWEEPRPGLDSEETDMPPVSGNRR